MIARRICLLVVSTFVIVFALFVFSSQASDSELHLTPQPQLFAPTTQITSTLTYSIYLPLINTGPAITIVSHNGYTFVYWSSEDSTWIEAYSEVRNNANQNVEAVEVTLNIYDHNGILLATDSGDAMLDVIRPGQTSPVEFYFDVPGGKETIETYGVKLTVRDTWSYTSEDTQDTFELISHSSFKDSDGATHIVGEAKNTGSTTADLQVTVWIRGQKQFQDMILAADKDWVFDVLPGETVSFETIFRKNFGDVFGYYELVLERD